MTWIRCRRAAPRAVDLQLGYTWLEKTEDYGGLSVDGSFYALNFPNHRFTAAIVWRVTSNFDLRFDNEFRIQEPNPPFAVTIPTTPG